MGPILGLTHVDIGHLIYYLIIFHNENYVILTPNLETLTMFVGMCSLRPKKKKRLIDLTCMYSSLNHLK